MSIIPEPQNGGDLYRTQAGDCVPSSAPGIYCPDPAFQISCDLRALLNNCNSRLTPEQINSLVSEMIALAEAFSPAGPWDCNRVDNLAELFRGWVSNTFNNLPGTVISAVCNTPELREQLEDCLTPYPTVEGDGDVVVSVSVDPTTGQTTYSVEMSHLTGVEIVGRVCSIEEARAALQSCLTPYPQVTSGTQNVHIEEVVDPLTGRVTYRVEVAVTDMTGLEVVELICGSAEARENLQNCLDPYPAVTGVGGVTVTPHIDPVTGRVTYEVEAETPPVQDLCGTPTGGPTILSYLLACIGGEVYKIAPEDITPRMVTLSNRVADTTWATNSFPPPFAQMTSPQTFTINNPHPVDILISLRVDVHVQLTMVNAAQLRVDWGTLVNGATTLTGHVLSSGPTANQTVQDANRTYETARLVPAGGSLTIHSVISASYDQGVHAAGNLVSLPTFTYTWIGYGLVTWLDE